jgi:putative FmdB family regulatory protein
MDFGGLLFMPIYEYQALDVLKACHRCRRPFETLQDLHEEPLTKCPLCGGDVRKVISWCRAAVAETSEESTRVERKIKQYETSGMWSHAAELADKHSEKVKDNSLKMRALDNYKKAGYDVNFLSKHANLNNE